MNEIAAIPQLPKTGRKNSWESRSSQDRFTGNARQIGDWQHKTISRSANCFGRTFLLLPKRPEVQLNARVSWSLV
jgi:hypothetical protein